MARGSSASVIIDDLDVLRPSRSPAETEPVLSIDPNAVLPGAIAAQLFELIPWRNSQVRERLGLVQLVELSLHHSPQYPRTGPSSGLRVTGIEDVSRSVATERPDQTEL